MPPLNSLALPDDANAVRKSQRSFYWYKFNRSFLQKIKYLGKSNGEMISRKLIDSIPLKYRPGRQFLFSPSFDNIDEFILVPEEFDFTSTDRGSHLHYVGFMIDENRRDRIDTSYQAAYPQILKKLAAKSILIYCSFGSVQYDDLTQIKKFLKELIKVCEDKNYVLVITAADDALRNTFKQLPGHIFIFKSVPQLGVLNYARVFITHGGLNSIKESVYKGVPMLVYPVNPDTDQNGNSSRVVFHHLGLRGDLARDSVSDIEQKIQRLIADEIFRQKIEQMKQTDISNTAENFLQRFKKIKGLG